jgi:hypothetical protein
MFSTISEAYTLKKIKQKICIDPLNPLFPLPQNILMHSHLTPFSPPPKYNVYIDVSVGEHEV